MEKLLKLFLSILAVLLFSCDSKQEKIEKAYAYGFSYYQGRPEHINAFAYALELDSTKAETWRELSVTYLKRGIPDQWKTYYEGAVKHDSIGWQPWRGYLYLWFYRDYKKAIEDFNASDTLTPNFIDAPQGHSVDYWRGIAYLGLKDYKNSIAYFDKHILKETQESGEDWVELNAFLFRGIAHFENNNLQEAAYNFDKLIFYGSDKSADANYYKALIFKELEDLPKAKVQLEKAIVNFKEGYFNSRPYVETLRQIYIEDLLMLQEQLN